MVMSKNVRILSINTVSFRTSFYFTNIHIQGFLKENHFFLYHAKREIKSRPRKERGLSKFFAFCPQHLRTYKSSKMQICSDHTAQKAGYHGYY